MVSATSAHLDSVLLGSPLRVLLRTRVVSTSQKSRTICHDCYQLLLVLRKSSKSAESPLRLLSNKI